MATSRTFGRRSVPLARRLFVLQLVLIVAVCAVLSVTSYLTARDSARDATADRVLSIAETLANDPFVAEAVTGPDPPA
ncbi:histidine kinase, partial [Burkholderia multivorans]